MLPALIAAAVLSQPSVMDQREGIDLPDDGMRVRFSDLNTARARQKGLLKNHQRQESYGGLLTRADMEKEVTLSRLSAQQVCFDIIVRSLPSDDKPLVEWELKVNDESVPRKDLQFAGDDVVQNKERSAQGERSDEVASVPTPFGRLKVRERRPTTYTARWVERRNQLCVPRSYAPGRVVSLELYLPEGPGQGMWHVFSWEVLPGQVSATDSF